MCVNGALGRTGAPARKKNRGRLIRGKQGDGGSRIKALASILLGAAPHIVESPHVASQTHGPSGRDHDRLAHRLASPAQEAPRPERPWDTDEDLRSGVAATLAQVPQAHSGVDQHRCDACFEQSEDQREKIESGPHHHHGPGAAPDPHQLEPVREPSTVLVELAIGQVRVADAATPVSASRNDHGQRVRLAQRHPA